jgi:dienelactone hydrolase
MAIIGNRISYTDNNTTLEGYCAYDDASSVKRPAVLISHTWVGRNQFVIDKAHALAELGYVGFALDMYGKGVIGNNAEESAALMQPFMQDRAKLQQRINAALTAIKQLDGVDSKNIAAIGFCFGGLCVLDLARMGAGLKGVVSFHGLLDAPDNNPHQIIKAKILALHGRDDPLASPDKVLAFQEEVTQAGADWQFVSYGNTMHAFTNPSANDPENGYRYQPDTDRRAWLAMKNFLQEIFN